jgi:16S rRNA (guanine1516-N2)-methyltransferase
LIDTPKETCSDYYSFVCVVAFSPYTNVNAQNLALQHHFSFHAYENKADFDAHRAHLSQDYRWMLFFDDAGVLTLSHLFEKAWQNFSVDFLELGFLSRLQRASMSSELLLKALGKKASTYRIFDATLGLGRDSLILASHGSALVGVERNSIIYCLVNDAFVRAKKNREMVSLLEKVSFLQGDAKEILHQKTLDPFDVVYLDPMFPPRKKSALVKKNMQVLHALLAEATSGAESVTSEVETLFLSAKAVAQKSVIVKRPLHGEFLTGAKPSHSVSGKDSRYDIYPS